MAVEKALFINISKCLLYFIHSFEKIEPLFLLEKTNVVWGYKPQKMIFARFSYKINSIQQ